jgi:hypothetical protein
MNELKTSELDMVLNCYSFLMDTRCYKYVALEVPFLSRCIDMVMISDNGRIYTIEFKINNIKQAIKQARDHSLGADYSYVCIPARANINAKPFIENKIGLYTYHNNYKTKLEVILIAPYNNPHKTFRDLLLKNTMKVLNDTEVSA